MAERINKLILEIETQATGNLAPTVKQITDLQTATKAAAGDTLKLVEAEKKLEQAAAQAGTSISTETKKQSDFAKAVQSTSNAMKEIGQTSQLKQAFSGASSEMAKVNAELKKFEQAARSAKSVDELTGAVNDLMAALPEDVRADAFKLIEKETAKLANTIERPVTRLRELKRLINTTDDPELLKQYQIEAGKLQDKLGDTNELVRALASDTFFSDTLVEGAQQAVGAFSAFQGVLALTADDQEEFARAAAKAQGALALLQGTQQILTNLKKDDNIVTRLQILAQKGYAAVVGESTGAMRGFRVALASIGLGLVVGAIIAIAANWDKWRDAITGSNDALRRNNEFTKEAIANTVEESAKIEIAKARLQDANTTQKERIEIIEELKRQYPGYLSDINSESASYESVEAALNKVNQALFIKSGIQARESFIAEQQKELFELQREIENTRKKADEFRAGFARDAEERGLNEFFAKTAENEALSLEKRADKTKEVIQSVINDIVKQSQDLSLLGGDPSQQKAKAEKTAKETAQILEGTIAFLQKQVSDLSDQLTNDLVIGSEGFEETVKRFIIAQEQLDDARAKLSKPTDIQLFTEGSIAALEKSVSDLNKMVTEIGPGDLREQLAEQLKEAQKELAAARKALFDEEIAQESEFNTAFLDNEESFQIQQSEIKEEGEVARLNIQIAFAKERLEILREQGKGETDEAQAIENQITLLQQQAAKTRSELRKKEIEERINEAAQFVQQVASAVSQVISLRQQEADRLTDIQQQRVSDAEKIAERGNVAVLRAEQERLDELNKKNERFAQQQIALAQIQLIAESALAVAKAAGQGGAAAAFTIAATLIALAAGFAQARAQSQAVAASFYEGGEYGYTGDGNPRQESRKLGKKPYTYHKSEYITPHEVLAIGNNKEWFKKIHLQRLDIDQLIGGQRPNVVVNTGSREIVDAINSIPGISISPNARAFFNLTEKHKKVQDKRTRLKNWKR